jgi:hypothetical protein
LNRNAAEAAAAMSGPEALVSRPMTIVSPESRVAYAAQNRAAISGFMPLPTIPRTPETLAIRSVRSGTVSLPCEPV